MMLTANSQNHAYIMGVFAVLAFSLTLPITKHLTPYLSVWDIGLGRSLLAACAAAVILIAKQTPIPNFKQIIQLIIVASGIAFGFPVLTAVGMQTVPSSHGGIILGGLPLATALIGCFLLKKMPTLQFTLVAVCGFAVLAIYSFLTTGSTGDLKIVRGDLALLGAVILAGLGYAQGGLLAREIGGWQVICWTLVISVPLLLPLTFILGDFQSFTQLPASGWIAFAFLALVNSLIGFFFWYRALAIGGVARISQIQLLQTFFTFGFARIWLGEDITLLMISFMIITLVIVWFSKRITVHTE